MDHSHLSTQFRGMVQHAAGTGVEFPPDVPGMAKIGGLHVPTSDVSMFMGPEDAKTGQPSWQSLHVQIPDEQGNIFSLGTMPKGSDPRDKEFSGMVMRGSKEVPIHSAEAFADLYGNVGPPSPFYREHNMERLDRANFISRLIGRRPGMAAVPGEGPKGMIYDLRSGDLSDADMNFSEANDVWREDKMRREREQQERRGDL